jgi:SAM-dependent methyltransferase
MEEVERCLLCNSTRLETFDRSHFRGAFVTNQICKNCGLVFQSPRLTAQSLEEYYRDSYAAMHQGAEVVNEEELRIQTARAENLVRLLRTGGFSPIDHLDLGCSTGRLMQAVTNAFGSESWGVEPSDLYRDFCIHEGLNVEPSLEILSKKRQQPFALVTMAHLLEHLPDPMTFLRDLRNRWLNKDGVLLVEVPNLFFHRSFELPHLTSFHRGTLSDILRQAGYQVEWLRKHGRPRHRRIPLYLTALARPDQDSENPPPIQSRSFGVGARRRLGRTMYEAAPRVMALMRRLRII